MAYGKLPGIDDEAPKFQTDRVAVIVSLREVDASLFASGVALSANPEKDPEMQFNRMKFAGLGLIAAAATMAASTAAMAQSSKYGCYRVTTAALNIRSRAWSRATVVGVAHRGDIVSKSRRFCALRGFWCPVRTANGVAGWADKKFLKRAACPK